MNSKRSTSSRTKRPKLALNRTAPASPECLDVTAPSEANPLSSAKDSATAIAEPSKARRIQGYEADWQRWDRLAQRFGETQQPQASLMRYLIEMAEAQLPARELELEPDVIPPAGDNTVLVQEEMLAKMVEQIPQLLGAITELTLQFQQGQQQQQQLNLLLAQVLQALTVNLNAEGVGGVRPVSKKAAGSSSKESFTTLRSQDLKKSHAKGSAEEKLRRAFEAIVAHNSAPHRAEADKWAINQNALAELTGCNRPAIKQFLKQYGAEIDRHHQAHGLLPRHNYAHGKVGTKITDIIHW